MELLKVSILSLGIIGLQTHASILEFGDAHTTVGSIKISGFLRAKFQDKDYSKSDHNLKFDTAKINLDYRNQYITGHIEYRCYQFDKLCDFSSLVDGWIGYDITDKNQIKVGVQALPFGPSRFWESNYFGGINTQVGIEDIHNLGINYQLKPSSLTTIDLGYFPTDAGRYHGSNGEAARYTANFIESHQPEYTSLKEKNMLVGRVIQEFHFLDSEYLKTLIGGSYWYSTIENRHRDVDGERKAWNIFSQISYDNLKITLTGGQNNVDSKDLINPNQSTVGSFDDIYTVANKGNFYTADLSYTFKDIYHGISIMPYAMYSTYHKDLTDAKNSTRSILGASFDYKNVSFVTEYIMGENDPLVGGLSNSLAQGDSNERNNLLNLTLLYFF